MDLRQLALKQQAVCQAFLDGKMDAKTFRGEMMTLAFTASGVSDDEMQVFNTVLKALYEMKQQGRTETVDVFKNVAGRKQDIVKVLENEPARPVPVVDTKAIRK